MPRAYRYGISAFCFGVLAAFAAVPETTWTSTPVVCLFRNSFDIECLGCGMTRALSAALHGRIEAALALNQGVMVTGAGLIGGVLQSLWR